MTKIPEIGEVWQHSKTGNQYSISGLVFNTITDQWDVTYQALYPCEIESFSRQMQNHEKAFHSTNEDGSPRFQLVCEVKF